MKLKHYLIASEENDYRPWITSSSALVYFTVIIWGLRFILPASLSFAQGYMDATDIMNRINQERSQRFIPTLTTNQKLITAAQGKADDMLHRSYFAHIDPDGNYVWPRIEAAGYKPYTTLGENLAMDFTSPDDLVAAWMNSPTHRANIVNPKFQDQGLALASGLYEPNHNSILVASLFGALAKTSTPTPSTSTSSSGLSGTTSVSQTNSSPSSDTLAIGRDVQISATHLSGKILIDVAADITGKPTLVTAHLNSQSINLIKDDNGKYAGTFTFDSTEILNDSELKIEARDASGAKTTSTTVLKDVDAVPDASSTDNGPVQIPISRNAQIVNLLRIIFGIFSTIFLGFLVADAIIIHRAKINRPGMNLTPQILIFLIISFVNLFVGFK